MFDALIRDHEFGKTILMLSIVSVFSHVSAAFSFILSMASNFVSSDQFISILFKSLARVPANAIFRFLHGAIFSSSSPDYFLPHNGVEVWPTMIHTTIFV